MARKKNSAAAKLGQKGGKSRWQGIPKKERAKQMRELAQKPRPGRKKREAKAGDS